MPDEEEGPRRIVGGEFLIPPSQIYAAIEHAETHHNELVNARFDSITARLDAMDRERARLFVVVQREIPEAIAHALAEGISLLRSESAVIGQRLDDMDKATALLEAQVHRVPTELQREITHLRELLERMILDHAALDTLAFERVDLRFSERDARFSVQANDAKVAIDAALIAMNALNTQQEASNKLAIDKAEKATKETIDKNEALANRSIDSVRDAIADLKDRVVRAESAKGAVREHGFDQRAIIALTISVLLALIGIASFVIAIATSQAP